MAVRVYMQKIIQRAGLFFCFFYSMASMAHSPWFTGPLLAPSGHTIPRGHTNVEFYGLTVFNDGQFNSSGEVIKTPLYKSIIANPILSHGFTDWLDVQMSLPYVFNSTQGRRYHRIADTAVAFGLQLLEQKQSTLKPDLRLSIQETIPTGRFDHLSPNLLGTDATGLGSYQTVIALNFQHIKEVFQTHYLRTRLSLSRLYSSPVQVHGLNSYGGALDTQGNIQSGIENDVDLAFEYTLTQNWVAVMEGYLSQGKATRFNGILTVANLGSPRINIGNGEYHEEALAPAVEYNFNEHIGVIGGVWFPVSGKNTAAYTTYVVALNAFW